MHSRYFRDFTISRSLWSCDRSISYATLSVPSGHRVIFFIGSLSASNYSIEVIPSNIFKIGFFEVLISRSEVNKAKDLM
jgi:hypothetical protein